MTSKTRSILARRPSPAMVVSCVALFLALAGTALAVPRNSIRSPQIVNGAVKTADLARNAVRSGKIADEAVTAVDLRANSVRSEEIRDGSVGEEEIAEDAVSSEKIAAGAVGAEEIAAGAVDAAEIAPGAVGPSEIWFGSVRAAQLGAVAHRQRTEPVAASATQEVTVNCFPGEQVLGGGGQAGHYGVEMVGSRPTGSGWVYRGYNDTGVDTTMTAYVLCLAN